ncbi:carcinoembryonic antigen-related cell adhesion molecule 5-like [Neoarius graeffei]|uniref:carcinoembryonic antigen-related cell adhesion molecule 5-like n=1 Tax=Neoarius graeffei TaxID=443677 RepID=UPI00298D313B|nr:carcinoembryonic antigen-related cell adhesion molecule 5-like [Neoarius graeffei]
MTERVKAVVSIQPDAHVFIGEIVTLRCDTQGGGDTQRSYSWYNNNNRFYTAGGYPASTKELNIWSVGDSDGGSYTCRGWDSEISDAVTLTVSEKPKATVRVNPQSSVYTGDTITLSCELQQGAGWQFLWYKNNQYLNSGATNTNTLRVTVDTAGETGYLCIARRRNARTNTDYYTAYSDEVRITAREKPKATVRVNPQSSIYTGDAITLSCELQQETGWEFLWDKKNPNSQYVNIGATDTNTFRVTVDTAGETGYRCGARRRNTYNYYTVYSDEVRITVREKPKPTVSVNPQSSVYTGDTITLSCELQQETGWAFLWFKKNPNSQYVNIGATDTNTLNVTVDTAGETGYQCGVRRHNTQTNTDYYTAYSNEVRITARGFRSSGRTVGVAVGLGFLFIALLILMILLWSYKRKKEKQQKTNQTSDQNQRRSGAEDSQAGHTPLQAGTEHIYDTVAQADTSGTGADAEQGAGVGDVTYAELELKPTKKAKKVKEKASLGDDTVYSELQQNMK